MASKPYIDTARILIVEESAVLRQLSLNMVEELGLIAQTANDVEDALKRMQDRDFDIVLVEVKAPEIKAIAHIEALRRSARACAKKVPIVAMSSGIKRGPLLSAGADDILMRPFMAGELEAVIDRWLSPGVIS
ncbi:MAG: response regulator [Candidatus Melainabacteria bacterium]|nr:response regulator [Candidatus Melainabacteria bacterium]